MRVSAILSRIGGSLRPLGLALLASHLFSAPAGTQEAGEPPRIVRLRFEGVESVSRAELSRSIQTEATRCKGLFARPFCWLTDWESFEEEHHLDRAELRRDELRIRIFYTLRGYLEVQVSSEVIPREEEAVEVVFRVREGPPVRIASLEVERADSVLEEKEWRQVPLPEVGEPWDRVALDSARARVQLLLGERGYLDAVVRDTAEIPTPGQAHVRLLVKPGPQAKLDTVAVEGNREVEDATVRRAVMLRHRQVLRSRDLVATRRSLYESNLFHEVGVATEPAGDSLKLLRIQVREAPPRSTRIGGGFNTLEFFQVEGRFTHYNWMGGGRRLEMRAAAGNLLAGQLGGRGPFRDVRPRGFSPVEEEAFTRPVWQVSADLQQPSFRSANNTLAIGAFAHRQSIPGVAIDEGYGAQFSATRRLDYLTTTSLSYRLEANQVEAGELYFCVNYTICDRPTIQMLQARQSLSPLSFSFLSDQSDNPLSPTRGYRARFDAEHASGLTLSDFRYHRASGEASYYRPFSRGRRVLAARVRAGWVRALGSTGGALGLEEGGLLHPRKRFYAGGSQSVRGFDENQLGPRILTVAPEVLTDPEKGGSCTLASIENRSCDPNTVERSELFPRPLGGSSVLEANLEFRFPVVGLFDGAVFVDGATVGAGVPYFEDRRMSAVTPGFGIRYRSGIGPIRADLGFRPPRVEELPVVTEVVDSETGERRIVDLVTPRRYDPLEDSGGFLRQLTSRLTLHLSIGQAF